MVSVLVLFLLILVNAFFAMSEIAVITLNDNKIKNMASQGHVGAQKVLKLTESSSDFLATIQVGVTLSGFLSSAVASQSFSANLADTLTFMPFSRSVLESISTIVITLLLSYFSLVLGELVPKKIAMCFPEKISFKVIGILLVVKKVFNPFVTLLSSSTNLILKLFRIDTEASENTVTEEEILMLVDIGTQSGVFNDEMKGMIENIMEFDDTTVEEIMTHRTEITALEDSDSFDEAVKIAVRDGYSRLPVFHENIDNIIGIVYVKDLLKYVTSGVPQNKSLTDIMHTPLFIAKTKKCNNLFNEFITSKTHIAILIDEYGGTAGLVSMEDVLESIVGDIQDEYDTEEPDFSKINDNTFTVDGTATVEEVSKLIGADLPKGDYETVAGLLIDKLGKIPQKEDGNKVEIGDVVFLVRDMDDRRISKITVVKKILNTDK